MAISFNGERLRDARRFSNLSITQLATKVDVSKQMISKYERGDAYPSPETVHKILSSLDFPLRFFQEQDNFKYQDFGTFYRSRLTSTQSEKKSSELLKKYLAILSNFFEQYVDFPDLDNIGEFEGPKDAAEQLRKKWDLGDMPISNMLYLLESKGFKLATIDSKSEKVDAFGSPTVVNNKQYYCILIDQDNNSYYRQQFSLSHELGHWVLHSKSVIPQDQDPQEYREMEKEASTFASNFLLPEDSFTKDISRNSEDLDTYLKLKSKWNVSAASMVYRSRSLGIIDANQYVKLQKKMSARGWKKNEPLDSIHSVPSPSLMKQAYKLLLDANVFGTRNLSDLLSNQYGLSLPNNILAELIGISEKEFIGNNVGKIIKLKVEE